MRTAAALLCFLLPAASAGELVFLRIDGQGSEEWVRPIDGATVVRIPGGEAILIGEGELPKWGDAVEEYLPVLERARGKMAE